MFLLRADIEDVAARLVEDRHSIGETLGGAGHCLVHRLAQLFEDVGDIGRLGGDVGIHLRATLRYQFVTPLTPGPCRLGPRRPDDVHKSSESAGSPVFWNSSFTRPDAFYYAQ